MRSRMIRNAHGDHVHCGLDLPTETNNIAREEFMIISPGKGSHGDC